MLGSIDRRACQSLHVPFTYHPHLPLSLILQAAVSLVPSASSMIIRALKEPPRDRKKVCWLYTHNLSGS